AEPLSASPFGFLRSLAMNATRSFHDREGRVQSEVIALCAEAADLADTTRRGDRFAAKRLARVESVEVDLDRGHRGRLDRVADRDRGMGVAAGVDHDRVE